MIMVLVKTLLNCSSSILKSNEDKYFESESEGWALHNTGIHLNEIY